MKPSLQYLLMSLLAILLYSCHEDPKNKFGGPSNARDTATSRRDTSSVGTRTDGHGE
ncbi:hypothetical protein [Mucilaginibacter terrae]|uniref:Lipoprotein n=1 Tax=Mucilaginibacter terrae TaxID=1955052 RepID=A0ABU3GW93_9SPHI|nr:hypothetical protein [Mucilaginibacter terrae]MDT3404041.1 hypothetical protein [Mucilaginibacter terrae]